VKPLKLTVLGSGGIFPDPNRGAPAYLLSHRDDHLLLDAGPGALRSLVKAGLSPDDLDGVCITHQHADHVGDLFLLLDLERYRQRTKPFWFAGAPIIDELIGFHRTWGREQPYELPFALERLPLPGAGNIGNFTIEGAWVPHTQDSVGLRITAEDRTLVYPGDCGPGKEVIDLSKDADLLVLECTLPSGSPSPAHLTPEDAAEIAVQSGSKKLVLSHFPPTADVAVAVAICQKMGLDVYAARDGVSYEL
jgi:ribonuclease BN (tRNA processing enzyme)